MKVYATQNRTYGYRKQICSYQRGEGSGEGKIGGTGLRDINTMYKIDKQQGHTLQHRELFPLSCNNI